MNYNDLGFSNFLTKTLFPKREPSSSMRTDYASSSVGATELKNNSIDNSQVKYNYRGFSAVVDSSGDGDYKKIQDAIDFVNENGGGKILVKAGDYIIEDTIILYSNISLEGEGVGLTNLDFNYTTNYISINDKENVGIRNLTIKNCYNNTNGTVYIYSSPKTVINSVNFEDNRTGSNGKDIFVYGSSRQTTISNCYASGGATFVYADITSGVYISDSRIYNYNNTVFEGGVVLNGFWNININNIRLNDCTSGLLSGKVNYSFFSNIWASMDEGSTYANKIIDISSGGVNFFSDCRISGKTSLDFMDINVNYTYFTNCQFLNSGSASILNLDGSNNNFNNCQFEVDTTGDGIDINATSNRFTGCKFNNSSTGKILSIDENFNLFSNCDIVGKASSILIDINSQYNRFSSCIIINNTNSGTPIKIDNHYNGFSNCHIQGNSSNTYDIHVTGDANNITGNLIWAYSTAPVRFDSGAVYNTVVGNRLLGAISDAGTGNVDVGNV